MYFHGQPSALENACNLGRNGVETSAFYSHCNIHVTLDLIMANDTRRRNNSYISDITQTYEFMGWRINHQIAQIAEALTRIGGTPHHYIKNLLILEKAAHLKAREHDGSRAADIARFEPILLSLFEADLNFQAWLLTGKFDVYADNTADFLDSCFDAF